MRSIPRVALRVGRFDISTSLLRLLIASFRFPAWNGSLLAPFFVACILAFEVGLNDPRLRHDWDCCTFGPTPELVLQRGLSGWTTNGIGQPNAYPTSYIVSTFIATINAAAGERSTLFLFVAISAWIASYSALRLTCRLGRSIYVSSACAVLSVFNPWVYNSLVAGHAFLLLAYAATFALIAELSRSRGIRWSHTALWIGVALVQIQFFLIDVAFLAVICAFARRYMPMVTALIVALPILAGTAFEAGSISSILYTLPWQANQSVPVLQGLLLGGYFAKYAETAYGGSFAWVMPFFAGIVAVSTCVVIGSPRRFWPVVAVPLAIALLASGTTGPLAVPYTWAVLNVRFSGIYRELYDLVGLIVLPYLAILAIAARSLKFIGFAVVVAAFSSALPWMYAPPSRFWVSATDVPPVKVIAPVNTRFALLPAFQPLSYRGRGSGADPDSYDRSDNITPLNDYVPIYPENVALARFVENGDTASLRGLSVAVILSRPALSSNVVALRPQSALPIAVRLARAREPRLRLLDPLPEMTFSDVPPVDTVPGPFLATAILATDVPANFPGLDSRLAAQGVRQIDVSNAAIKAAHGWVDARLGFTELPKIAQPYGGALTTSEKATLTVVPGDYILAWIRGRLFAASGPLITIGKPGFQWIRLPAHVSQLRCKGMCVIAIQAKRVVPVHHRAAPNDVSVAFRRALPWLVETNGIPAKKVVRYNVRYEASWTAFSGLQRLPHVRLNGIVNGWYTTRGGPLVIVDLVAALQFLLEMVGLGWFLGLLYCCLRRSPATQTSEAPCA